MPQIKVAILGLGSVGRSLARLTQSQSEVPIDVCAVSDRSGTAAVAGPADLERFVAAKEAGSSLAEVARTLMPGPGTAGWPEKMHELGVHAVVNCIQSDLASGEPALRWILEALRGGLDVVTVDKGPVVNGFRKLTETAVSCGSRFRFSGTTGVAVALEPPLHAIEGIEGVLNGTTNYVLSQMLRSGSSLPEALAEAQRMGIAEPDPRLDIEGWDSACKIVILANALMGVDARLEWVDRHGIEAGIEDLVRIARSSGSAVRLVARARRNGSSVDLAVRPEIVRPETTLYSVDGTSKAAVLEDARGNRRAVRGTSGRDAIARTIISDLRFLLHTPSRA